MTGFMVHGNKNQRMSAAMMKSLVELGLRLHAARVLLLLAKNNQIIPLGRALLPNPALLPELLQ